MSLRLSGYYGSSPSNASVVWNLSYGGVDGGSEVSLSVECV